MLELKSISRHFDNKVALSPTSFHVKKGEVVLIRGNNGSGKTTLLRIIANLLTPTSGSMEKSKKTNIGWLPSDSKGPFLRLNGLENLELFSSFLKVDQKILEQRIEAWSILPSFKESLLTPFAQCSTGMKTVLMMALTCLHSPDLLIWDEPFSSLYCNTKDHIFNNFSELTGCSTLIFSSHHFDEKDINRNIKVIEV